MQKPVMTLADVVQDLRGIGMKTNSNTIADGIEAGVYPFGKILKISETGRRHIQIFRTDYERWKAEVLLGTGPSSTNPVPTNYANLELISTNTFTQENNDIVWEVIIRSWAKKESE